MLRILKNILPFSGQHIQRRRRHQFVPSVTGSAADLEGRTMLSGAGGAAVANAAVDHAAIYHHAAHHAMKHHAVFHHHTQVHHVRARHAAAHHARFHAAARSGHLSKEQRVMAQRQAFATATGAAAPHDPVIGYATPATTGGSVLNGSVSGLVIPGVIAGPDSSSNYTGAGLTAETYNGYSPYTAPGTLPAGLQNAYRTLNGLGVPQPVVVAQFPANDAVARFYNVNPIATAANSNTGITASPSVLASMLTSLLGSTGTTTTTISPTVGIINTARAAALAHLLGGTGTTAAASLNTTMAAELAHLLGITSTATTGTGTGTFAGSPLASLLIGGQVPTAGMTTATTGSNLTIPGAPSFFPTPLALNSAFSFIHSPVNPSPMPPNGVLAFTRSPINPSPLPLNGVLL